MKKELRVFYVACLAALVSAACMVPSAKKAQKVPSGTSAVKAETATQKTTSTAPTSSAEATEQEPPAQAPAADQSAETKALKIVRVLLADNQSETKIEHSGRVYIYTQNLDKKYKVSSEGTLSVRFVGNGKVQVGTLKSDQPIIIEPAKETLLTWSGNIYSGKIFVVPAQNTFILVEHADLETYLYGVLPYEMSYSWPAEALKAQAVAARTYTLRTLETVKNKYFDLYSDVRSQMYKGGGKQYPSVKTAVDATKSQVLMYNDKLFYTYYHGNCGGGTDDVKSWNESARTIKPLSGASCAYDSHSKTYSWKQDIAHSKILNYMKTVGLTGKLKNIRITQRTKTGRVTRLAVQTNKGVKIVACNPLRLAIGLKSCKITKMQVDSSVVHFAGHGYGHGVGMCQDGANGMAKAGKTYEQILKNYYPGAKLTTLKK